jgi:hypothetical protein
MVARNADASRPDSQKCDERMLYRSDRVILQAITTFKMEATFFYP